MCEAFTFLRCFLLFSRNAQLVSYYHVHLAISQFQGAILTSATRTRFFFSLPVSRSIFVGVISHVCLDSRFDLIAILTGIKYN